MFIGALLLVIGIIMILTRADVIPGGTWQYIWPILLIAIGIKTIFSSRKK
jgi:uncharacterized membrane protein HdeD (DUF308 family)